MIIDCFTEKDIGKNIKLKNRQFGWITYNPFRREDSVIGFLFINPNTAELQWIVLLPGDHIREIP